MNQTIYLAGGCFWGTQHFIDQINGIVESEVGFANSNTPNPSYKLVCTGATNAVETVKITYNPEVLPLDELLNLYFMTIDPTSVNRQGGDSGTQYRTGIYYIDNNDRETIDRQLAKLQTKYDKPLAIEVKPLQNYYPAEEYHQNYLDKNPNGYCHISPELIKFIKSHKPRT